MVKSRSVPDRGEIIWIDFDPVRGHEERGRRPALVISPKYYNSRSGLVFVCPITSRVKNYPFEVPLLLDTVRGAVLVDHVRSVDWQARNTKYIERISEEIFKEVQAKLRSLID